MAALSRFVAFGQQHILHHHRSAAADGHHQPTIRVPAARLMFGVALELLRRKRSVRRRHHHWADVAVVISTSCRIRSVVPQTTLLFGHVVRVLAALAARFDAAPKAGTAAVCRATVRLRRFALAVLEAARIPTDAHLQRTQTWRPETGHVVAARRSGHRKAVDGRFETRYGRACGPRKEGSDEIVRRNTDSSECVVFFLK